MTVAKMIVPSPIKLDEVIRFVDLGLLNSLEEVKASFSLTYATWDGYPKWVTTGPLTKGGKRQVTYKTNDEIYVMVDDGTPPHRIEAKNAPFLSFKTDSIPKTKPGQLMSTAGFPGSKSATAQSVQHPGAEPRNFSQRVKEELDEKLGDRVQKQVDKTV